MEEEREEKRWFSGGMDGPGLPDAESWFLALQKVLNATSLGFSSPAARLTAVPSYSNAFVCVCVWPHPQHGEVPGPGIQPTPQQW